MLPQRNPVVGSASPVHSRSSLVRVHRRPVPTLPKRVTFISGQPFPVQFLCRPSSTQSTMPLCPEEGDVLCAVRLFVSRAQSIQRRCAIRKGGFQASSGSPPISPGRRFLSSMRPKMAQSPGRWISIALFFLEIDSSPDRQYISRSSNDVGGLFFATRMMLSIFLYVSYPCGFPCRVRKILARWSMGSRFLAYFFYFLWSSLVRDPRRDNPAGVLR